jgi:RHS repeat-associated protein
VAARYQYEPFGNLLASSGIMADINLYRFSSKELHQNSGLYYYGFRFYEPGLQRWINADPIEEDGGLNLYGFVYNDPLYWMDPYGDAASDLADLWQGGVNKVGCYLTKGSTTVSWIGCVNTACELAGGVAEPLRFGETAGKLSETGGDAADIAPRGRGGGLPPSCISRRRGRDALQAPEAAQRRESSKGSSGR